jgi:ankyrin repeat protein
LAPQVVAQGANVHALEVTSGRSAVHKAAFWGHVDLVHYLTATLKICPNTQDSAGDTALHDAAKVCPFPG